MRALNVRCFFLTDQAEKGDLKIKCCPVEEMVGDHMSKPPQGNKFCSANFEIKE